MSAGEEGDWAEKLRVVLAERDTPLVLMLMRGAAAAAMEKTMPSSGNMRQRTHITSTQQCQSHICAARDAVHAPSTIE